MKKYPLYFIFFIVLGVFLACERDDDEPQAPGRVISRLYVSTSDYDGSGTQYDNLFVIDPVDSTAFPEENRDSITGVVSGAKGGSFIHFTPFGGIIFQGSQNTAPFIDTAVQVLTVSEKGIINPNYGRIPNRRFDGVRGLFYTIVNEGTSNSYDYLVMLNSSKLSNAKGTRDSLFVIERPKAQRNFTVPRFYMPLDYNPWGIYISDRDVYVTSFSNATKAESPNGIIVYKNLTSKFVANTKDSLLSNELRFDLTIAGARRIRGISYSKVKDLMVVTDVGVSESDTEGRILIFENFSKYTSASTISPDRVITSTSLRVPLDVAIDPRENGRFLYVADSGSKQILRFNISDSGAVTPNASVGLFGRTPVSLSLDARSNVLF